MSEHRDIELGEALRDLGLPEHGDDFFTVLWAEADRGPAAGTAREGSAEAESTSERLGWWTRRRARTASVAVAATAVAVVVAVVLLGLPGVERTSPSNATAADVLASMDLTGETPVIVTADVVSTYYQPSDEADDRLTLRRHILVDTLGDWMRVLTVDDEDALAEPAMEGTLFDARQLQFGEWRAPPDWDGTSEVPGVLYTNAPASHGILRRYNELSTVSLIRALIVGSDAPVESVTYLDRDAWHMEIEVAWEGDKLRHPDRVELTIDKETGYPLETIDWRGDTKDGEHRVVSFEVEEGRVQAEADEFEAGQAAIANPYGDPPEDLGCRRAPLERFVELVGRPAIVAGWMPDGFDLADATTKTADWISGDPETSVVYRGGLWSFAVDSWLGGGGSQAISDPMQQSDLATEETATLARGLFKGCEAHIVMDTRARYSASHLWVSDEKTGIVVAILGDLSRDEFFAVAESLELGPK